MSEILGGIREEPAPEIEAARALVRRLFAGVLDKGGKPYAAHCERVEARLPSWASDDARCAAILHDVLEDTGVIPSELLEKGFSSRTVWLVEKLSRVPGSTYIDWVRSIAATGDAELIAIKIADNLDNSDPERIACLPAGQRDIVKRYERSLLILEPALREARYRAGILEGLRIAAEMARAFDCMPCRAPAAWGEDVIEHYNDGQIDACGSIASAIEARAKEMGLAKGE